MFVFSLVPGLLLYNLWCLDFEGTMLFPEIYYEGIVLFPKIYYEFANICWITEKAREFQKNIYFCFIDYAKAFVWITTNCGMYNLFNFIMLLFFLSSRFFILQSFPSQNHFDWFLLRFTYDLKV